MNFIETWVKDHNISSHSLVAAYGLITAFLASDASARGMVTGFLAQHPTISVLSSFVGFVLLTYKGSHSTAGQAAQLVTTAKTDPAAVRDAVASANAQSPEIAPVVSVASAPQAQK